MCGIVGIVSRKEFSSRALLSRLKRLEYRGYDSYGFRLGSTTLKVRRRDPAPPPKAGGGSASPTRAGRPTAASARGTPTPICPATAASPSSITGSSRTTRSSGGSSSGRAIASPGRPIPRSSPISSRRACATSPCPVSSAGLFRKARRDVRHPGDRRGRRRDVRPETGFPARPGHRRGPDLRRLGHLRFLRRDGPGGVLR